MLEGLRTKWWSLALVAALAVGAPSAADAEDVYDSSGTRIGLGLNASLAPGLIATTNPLTVSSAFNSAFSLRIWVERLMINPVFGFGLVAGDVTDIFQLTAGVHFGYALASGNLRPIIGGGMVFGFITSRRGAAFVFGPSFGFEYRFEELPNFGLDAALWLPFQVQFEPHTVFTVGTVGSPMVGFHYYF